MMTGAQKSRMFQVKMSAALSTFLVYLAVLQALIPVIRRIGLMKG